MPTTISGETFVRTYVHHLDTNGRSPLPSPAISDTNDHASLSTVNGIMPTSVFSKLGSRQPNSAVSTRPASVGSHIPYRSLLAVASSNENALSVTPPMHLRPYERLDVHYFYFLLVQFEHFGLDIGNPALLGDAPQGGLLNTETTTTAVGKAPSVMSSESVASTFSTLSLTNVRSIFNRPFQKPGASQRPIHEDIERIYKHFARVSALKLYKHLIVDPHTGVTLSGKRPISMYEKPLPQDGSVVLSLSPFRNLSYLELSNIHPRYIEGWPELQRSLVHLVVKGATVEDAADVLLLSQNQNKDVEWERLKTLSFADNSLTTLESGPLKSVGALTHLDVSSNLMIDVPAALSDLTNLQSLNLSNNMISFVTGINTVLGNIQELRLRGNRLTVLAGLERLWALERLDLRDNRIEDSAEIGRFTSLPNIENIWVQGNPFTKLQPDYRVKLFTTFKMNDNNIQLDGTGPGIVESWQISSKDDSPASAPAAVTKANASLKAWPAAQAESADPEAPASAEAKPITRAKTKKAKRIVKLKKDDNDVEQVPKLTEDGKRHLHRLAELEKAVQSEQKARQMSSKQRRARSMLSSRSRSPGSTSTHSNSKGSHRRSMSPPPDQKTNKFREKIEAMRSEAGTEWLRVLQELELERKRNES